MKSVLPHRLLSASDAVQGDEAVPKKKFRVPRVKLCAEPSTRYSKHPTNAAKPEQANKPQTKYSQKFKPAFTAGSLGCANASYASSRPLTSAGGCVASTAVKVSKIL